MLQFHGSLIVLGTSVSEEKEIHTSQGTFYCSVSICCSDVKIKLFAHHETFPSFSSAWPGLMSRLPQLESKAFSLPFSISPFPFSRGLGPQAPNRAKPARKPLTNPQVCFLCSAFQPGSPFPAYSEPRRFSICLHSVLALRRLGGCHH